MLDRMLCIFAYIRAFTDTLIPSKKKYDKLFYFPQTQSQGLVLTMYESFIILFCVDKQQKACAWPVSIVVLKHPAFCPGHGHR